MQDDEIVRVLYIEENNADVVILKLYIDSNNIPVTIKSISNFTDALGLLYSQNESYDVVLLDYCLKGIYCVEALQQIKNNEKTKHLPVIVFSNWDDKDDKSECMENKADHFIIKPAGFDDFSELIQIILSYRKFKKSALLNA